MKNEIEDLTRYAEVAALTSAHHRGNIVTVLTTVRFITLLCCVNIHFVVHFVTSADGCIKIKVVFFEEF